MLVVPLEQLIGDLQGESDFLEKGEVCAATPKIFTALLQALK